MTDSNSLQSGPIREVLDRLHADAKSDRLKFLSLIPRFAAGLLRGQKLFDVLTPEAMKDFYLPVSREQGEFLYLTARAIGATKVVEFGTSFGISTIYLAAAVRDNGSGEVIGSEIEASKVQVAKANLEAAGLAAHADVRLGDAMETLRDLPEPIDLVLLDGWKDLYIPVLERVTPRLRPGSVVLADNIFTFRKSLRPYVESMQSGERGFASTTLHIADGFEYSVYLGKQ
ncbi:MAG: class I SAM-dependent methyltransferase [Myxococcales bacterium]|nr:class I SAM-dependent methyltransferase [Myxococcales bacterium]TDJ21273.1 MAG: methyltransferase [Deltaproteobacteria bacterium]